MLRGFFHIANIKKFQQKTNNIFLKKQENHSEKKKYPKYNE